MFALIIKPFCSDIAIVLLFLPTNPPTTLKLLLFICPLLITELISPLLTPTIPPTTLLTLVSVKIKFALFCDLNITELLSSSPTIPPTMFSLVVFTFKYPLKIKTLLIVVEIECPTSVPTLLFSNSSYSTLISSKFKLLIYAPLVFAIKPTPFSQSSKFSGSTEIPLIVTWFSAYTLLPPTIAPLNIIFLFATGVQKRVLKSMLGAAVGKIL